MVSTNLKQVRKMRVEPTKVSVLAIHFISKRQLEFHISENKGRKVNAHPEDNESFC